ncbi:nitroreductase family deazaflavin-dependent oxidoreductase [Tomitella fengzijianii]|uniref:Nitroreductase family deazaflavin-dependent oxidoreductase n=1 Tax=Tomitella fengzijianii TaxID=2597660 RepID=A0A516X6A3_9ACTN|nr:nitroreductase family deazaflavin-dependent oxidoreductase [Tomitella fengzijianii]QDQ98602.1 nitroreductase family deazaflavin-dependent oxidoreductase [Tomitella fengzijianii]
MDKRPPRLDSPVVPSAIKAMSRAQTWVYKRTGGRVGGKWRVGAGFRKPVPTLLLEHRGRKSGRTYTVPLLYLVVGGGPESGGDPLTDDLVVVASQGGLPTNPQWYRNLVADPDVAVQIGSTRRAVRAHVAGADERERLWPALVEQYADFAAYQSWTDRTIPVVVLQPR